MPVPTIAALRPSILGVAGGEAGVIAATAAVEVQSPETRLAGLFDTHHQRLYRLARRMSRSVDEAKDAVQDTFLRAARDPGAIPDSRSGEEAWLVRVLVNVMRDRWRQRSGRQRLEAQFLDRPAILGQHPEAAFVAGRAIWQAMDRLGARRRAVVVLHEIEGVSFAEIGSLLGISAVTARWHLSRARRELAHLLREERQS
jgi:RNA polymerase sigma factor (sigma-70 family)